MPCHCKVDYECDDWPEQVELAPHCAGRAAYFRNRLKLPRDKELANFVSQVEKNKDIFASPAEFLLHHSKLGT